MKYFFDLDGVLFDWEAGFLARFGRTPESMTDEEFQAAKKEMAESGFYEDLKVIEEGFNLFHAVRDMGEDVAVLTSVGKYASESVAEQKKKALVKALGYLPEFFYTQSSKEKAKYAGQGVLVDDRMKSVAPFKAAGGEAVLFVRTPALLAA